MFSRSHKITKSHDDQRGDASSSGRRPWWLWPLLIALLPVVIGVLLAWLLWSILLLLVVWVWWCPRGRYALVVYSRSPVWQEYFELHVLPHLGRRAVVLNWSERKMWKMSLAVLLFRTFARRREFNPIAIVFEPVTWPRRFRFYRAFRSFKHGQPEEVETIRRAFFDALNRLAPET